MGARLHRMRKGMDGVRLIPYAVDFSTFSDGALPSGWIGPSWRIASGKVVNDLTLGPGLFTNPGAEGAYTAGIPANWAKDGADGTWSEEGTIIHGGAKAIKFVGGTTNNVGHYPLAGATAPNLTAGEWYRFEGFVRNDGPGNASLRRLNARLTLNVNITPTGAYQRIYWVEKAATSGGETLAIRQAGTTPQTFYADDFSLKALTYSSQFLLRRIPHTNIILSAPMSHSGVTLGNSQIGLAIADDPSNPQNFLLAYYNGTNLKLSSFANRVETNLINGSVSWVNGELPEIRISGTTAQLWYAGLQVGANQTIGAAITACRYAGGFSNDLENSIGAVNVS